MALILRRLYSVYRYTFDELADPRTSEWPLVGSPWPVLLLLAGYLFFVLNLGPKLMRNRRPFQLDKVLVVYNAVQVVCSLHVVREGIMCCYANRQYNLLCEPVDYSEDAVSVRIARGVYFYYLMKILDLLDTVFFILRKKENQISFLHVYHHTGMVMLTYTATKFLAGGHGVFVGVTNSLVHAVMYSYYLITALRPEYRRNIWWKKYITQMQMFQFGIIVLHSLVLLAQPSCGYPKFTVGIVVPQNFFMFALFYDFYRKAYRNKRPAVAATSPQAAKENGIGNESTEKQTANGKVLTNGKHSAVSNGATSDAATIDSRRRDS